MKKVYIVSVLLFLVYLVILLQVTIFSHPVLRLYPDFVPQAKLHVTLIGILKHRDLHYILKNMAGNILLFLPFGFLLPIVTNYTFAKLSARRFALCCLFGLFASVAIETVQLYFAYRIFDMDDVVLNTIGFVIGCSILYALYYTALKRIPSLRGSISKAD